MRNSFAPLHPVAMAVAGAVGALALAVLGGFGMMGAGSMMGGGWTGGGWTGGGWMMGGYGAGYPGYHMTFAGGLFALLWVAIAGGIAGWVVASTYNAVSSKANSSAASGTDVAPR